MADFHQNLLKPIQNPIKTIQLRQNNLIYFNGLDN